MRLHLQPRFCRAVAFSLLLGVLLASPLAANPPSQSSVAVGTWRLSIEAPGLPPFFELLVLHQGGTVSESNTLLHANSQTFGLTAGPGSGVWRQGPGNAIEFRFEKLVFDPTGAPLGVLRVEGRAGVAGGQWSDLGATSTLRTIDGTLLVDFGSPQASGVKMSVSED